MLFALILSVDGSTWLMNIFYRFKNMLEKREGKLGCNNYK